MSKVSFIISARGEQFQVSPGMSCLQKTVQDIYDKARGEFEVIVIFDGPPYQEFPDYKTLTVIREPEWAGTKITFNKAARIASGKYLCKVDAHCIFAEGFDEVLKADMEDSWIVMPRFYHMEVEKWDREKNRHYDYFMLPFPFNHPRGVLFRAGAPWHERTIEREDISIDENLRNHGSFFFMSKDYFWNCLDGFKVDGAGSWNGEEMYLTMKTWLGPWGGKLMVNKKTWFAHMHRGSEHPREFGFSHHEAYESARWTARYWMLDAWKDRVHNFEWLIDKFWPIPGWSDNWREIRTDWIKTLPDWAKEF